MQIHAYYSVCRGKEKSACDDTLLIGMHIANEESGEWAMTAPGAVCLCDGVGGNAGGKEASNYVCEKISQIPVPESPESLSVALQSLNHELIFQASNIAGKDRMATTMTGLFFTDSEVFLMHAGNTRLCSVIGGYLQQMTEDQTTSRWLKSIGQIEAAKACNQSEIRCAFGGGSERFLENLVTGVAFDRGIPDILLLTSDGVHDTLSEDDIEEIFEQENSMTAIVNRLTDLALEKGSEDDRSAVILELSK